MEDDQPENMYWDGFEWVVQREVSPTSEGYGRTLEQYKYQGGGFGPEGGNGGHTAGATVVGGKVGGNGNELSGGYWGGQRTGTRGPGVSEYSPMGAMHNSVGGFGNPFGDAALRVNH